MKISLKEIAGVRSAQIEVDRGKIALLIGRNEQAKTSVIRGCQAVLTATRMVNGRPMTEAHTYIYDDAARAVATLETPAGNRTIIWHENEVKMEGIAPKISPTAAGMTRLSKLPVAARTAELLQMLGAEPTAEDLLEELKAIGWKQEDERYKTLSASIAGLNWDGAFAEYKAEGQSLKRDWLSVTGSKGWGIIEAPKWRPVGFLAADPRPAEEVRKMLALAQTQLENALQREAVSADRLTVLEESASKLPELEKELAKLKKDLAKLEKQQADKKTDKPSEYQNVLEKLGETQKQSRERIARDQVAVEIAGMKVKGMFDPCVHDCPACGDKVRVSGSAPTYSLAIAEEQPSEAEREKAAQEYDLAADSLKKAYEWEEQISASIAAAREQLAAEQNAEGKGEREAQQQLVKQIGGVTAKIQEAQNAGNKAKELKAKIAALPSDDAQALTVEAARVGIAALTSEIAAGEALIKATALHARIVENLKLQEILAVDGLRKKKLGESLEVLNNKIAEVCKAGGWQDVRIKEDLSIWYGTKRPREYDSGPSESGQFRADVALQVAIAQLQGDPIVLIDRADVMDVPSRPSLFGMLNRMKQGAIVAMTVGQSSDAPDMAALGCGQTYWVENGFTEPVSKAVANAAS